MVEPPTFPAADDFAAALDWWREAGVDHDFSDDATEWLAEPEPEIVAAPAARTPQPKQAEPAEAPRKEIPAFGGDRAGWPADLAAFRRWWLEEPSLDAGGTGARVPPRGDAKPALMVIVAEPEQGDSDTLLSGPQGRLLAGFLRAAGIAFGEVYLASALPRPVPLPDWENLRAAGIGKLLEHHAHLAQPQRIVVFGRNILSLIGHATAQDSAVLREFNHEGRSVPVMGSRGLADLLRSAAGRERLWKRWLDWTDG